MKAAILFSLARQVEGEYVFVNVIKAHVDPNQLRQHIAESQLPRTGKFGDVNCVLEYGVITDVEIEGLQIPESPE
jgi:hypothetical protein